MTNLCTIDEIAQEWNVPKASLRTAAEKHGFLVRIGRALRLERDRLPELLKKCRDQPKEQGSPCFIARSNFAFRMQFGHLYAA
jgi:hypothetical protein